ncbi:hypothetical protein DRQ32_04645 [bacterium]|nr:MAG: hypothetical protein DRQ32_04645 [bacterium]
MVALLLPAARAADLPARGIDLDTVAAARVGPERARWFFSPEDFPASEQAIADGVAGVERVAILTLFDDRWILEAPADSVSAVTVAFDALGELKADESGTPALNDAMALVDAGQSFLDDLDLGGDVSSTVAILDSGCDTAHDDIGDPDQNDVDGFPDAGDAGDWSDATDLFSGELGFRVVGWHDVTDDLPAAVGPWDDHFHGTAMASAGFGSGSVDREMLGVAPRGRFVVVKTWNFEGRWERWASDLFLGIEWLILNSDRLRVQACVVGTVWETDHGFGPAVQALADAGILFIAAAGNDGGLIDWPGQVKQALTVGAATKSAEVASYSAHAGGLTAPPILDLVAPGGSVLLPTGAINLADNEPNDTYRGRTGTSIAAAMVAGAVSVLAEAAQESGAFWPQGPDRVTWLTGLLGITCVELAAAEQGAAGVPRLDRGRPDQFEGHGLLQVRAAAQVVDNIIWAGERADLELTSPAEGSAVWAARIPAAGGTPLTLSLFPAAGIDADLYVYEDTGRDFRLLGSGTRAGGGQAETVVLQRTPESDLVVVARRISGAGSLIFASLQDYGPSSLWPRELRSRQTTSPVAADLDGDGTLEVILTNSFAVDRRIHEFVVYDARGRTFRFFPRSVDTSPFFGRLTAPAVGVVGGRLLIAAGSDVGRAFAVSDSARVLFSVGLTSGGRLTPPVILDGGVDGRLLFGSQTGIHVVDETGQVLDLLPLGSPVVKDLAVGDFDGDGAGEIVAITDDGLVHVLEKDGTPLPGWPRVFAGELASPLLIGTPGMKGVAHVILAETTATGELLLHEIAPDGTPAPSSPSTLDRGGLPLLQSSPLAAARTSVTGSQVVIGAALGTWTGDQFCRLWRYEPGSAAVTWQEYTYSVQHLSGMLHFSRGLIMDEPRLLELSSHPGLEALQTIQLDWNESFVGNPRRYGSSRRIVEWPEVGTPQRTALSSGHDSFPAVWGMTPLVTDFEADGYPDLVVVRDDTVYRAATNMRWTLDGMWPAERGGRTRNACLDCDGPRFVDAPARVGRLRLSVSPNPFNPRTVITAAIPAAGELDWGVYDARGRRVRAWKEHAAQAGIHRTPFDGNDQRGRRLSSGVYFLRLQYGSQTVRARMVLVR